MKKKTKQQAEKNLPVSPEIVKFKKQLKANYTIESESFMDSWQTCEAKELIQSYILRNKDRL